MVTRACKQIDSIASLHGEVFWLNEKKIGVAYHHWLLEKQPPEMFCKNRLLTVVILPVFVLVRESSAS